MSWQSVELESRSRAVDRIPRFEGCANMETKVCTSCNLQKPIADFHRFGKDGARIGKWCEECYTRKIAGKPAPSPKQVS